MKTAVPSRTHEEAAATVCTGAELELKIQDGRVAEAHVGNRQPGAEAFEATALHIARQRRYPPGTSLTETLLLRVANQFGRKEP